MSDFECQCHKRIFKNKYAIATHIKWVTGVYKKENLKGINKGELNPMWKGNKPIHKTTVHEWVNNNIKKDKMCEICGDDKNIDLANVTGKYERDFSNWKYLCRKCHMLSDGRMNNLKRSQEVII